MSGHLVQMEFISHYSQNSKAELTGERLVGELDFMTKNIITLFPTDQELKSALHVYTSFFTTDTSGNTVDASTELIIFMFNYNQNLDIHKIYGLFCYATIFNYMILTNLIRDKNIRHNDALYVPTVLIQSFESIEKDIRKEMNRVYRA